MIIFADPIHTAIKNDSLLLGFHFPGENVKSKCSLDPPALKMPLFSGDQTYSTQSGRHNGTIIICCQPT